MQHSIRLAAGDMGRLKAIAGALGCLGTRQIGIGEPSISAMMKQVASGELVIVRKERGTMALGTPRTLDIATAKMKAEVAAERHCYRTAQAYLDVVDALIDGRDGELDRLYQSCNDMSRIEQASDATGYTG